MTNEDNFISHYFGGRPYPQIQELVQDLNDVLAEYAGQIPLAAAIGALRIVEHGLLENHSQESS